MYKIISLLSFLESRLKRYYRKSKQRKKNRAKKKDWRRSE
jgi:hypothetical protein